MYSVTKWGMTSPTNKVCQGPPPLTPQLFNLNISYPRNLLPRKMTKRARSANEYYIKVEHNKVRKLEASIDELPCAGPHSQSPPYSMQCHHWPRGWRVGLTGHQFWHIHALFCLFQWVWMGFDFFFSFFSYTLFLLFCSFEFHPLYDTARPTSLKKDIE